MSQLYFQYTIQHAQLLWCSDRSQETTKRSPGDCWPAAQSYWRTRRSRSQRCPYESGNLRCRAQAYRGCSGQALG